MRLANLLALCFLIAPPCVAQSIVVAESPETTEGVGHLEIEVDPVEITVGDPVEARLTLIWTGPEPAAEPRFPIWQRTWGGAAVLAAGEIEASSYGARRVYRQKVEVTAFATGEVTLPKVSVTLPLEAGVIEIEDAGEASFEVRSVLPEDPRELARLEPRPEAPPRALVANRRFAWTAGTGLGLSLILVWLLGRRIEAPTGEAPTPTPTEPLAELLQHLRRLDPTAVEPTHTGLSRALRHFLGRSLLFPATESTTHQIRRRLRATRLEPVTISETSRLLSACDQVKFARAPVDAAATRDRLAEARRLARDVDRALRPVVPAAEC